ncbi:molybdate ABC transporter substrate-binding protein [Tessaracoccus sp. G1721]
MNRLAVTVLAVVLLAAGCSQPTGATTATPGGAPDATAGVDGAVVFAAASLSKVLPPLAEGVTFSFDGSSGLVDQLVGGAPADVFASADKKNMDRAVEEGVIDGEPVMFATNTLVVIVPADNPAGVTGFDESLNAGKLVTCAVEVPCGAVAARLAEAAGIELRPVSEETKVSDVLGKVASGEADAGLVYATDAASSADVISIEIPGADADPNTYWVAVVAGAPHPEAARAFVESLTGEWQEALIDAGFGPPQ